MAPVIQVSTYPGAAPSRRLTEVFSWYLRASGPHKHHTHIWCVNVNWHSAPMKSKLGTYNWSRQAWSAFGHTSLVSFWTKGWACSLVGVEKSRCWPTARAAWVTIMNLPWKSIDPVERAT